jgi:FAD/FMN-containing dehydrogenase
VSATEELAAYAVDGLVPSSIVRPASADETAEVVRFAVAEKLAVLPLGSRSKCEMGMPLECYDLAIDMSGLRGIAHFDPGDLTLSVDAGMPLRELETYLKEHRQFLPLAVPCFESATVGGTIASGMDSALRLQYGSARDFVIGAEFVDGTGQLCKSGGRVVKNVTGYDLHKLLIGSFGTLGVITRINFKTFPLPDVAGGHLASFQDIDEALEYRKTVETSGLPVSNLELLDSNTAKMMQAILQRSSDASVLELGRGEWQVYSSFEGNAEVVTRVGRELEGIARKIQAVRSRILEVKEGQAVGGMLRECFEWLRWASPSNVIYRLALPAVKVATLSELSQIAVGAALRAAVLVRAASIVYFTVLAETDDEVATARLAKTVSAVRSIALAAGGHAALLHAPLAVKKIAGGEMSKMALDLQQRIKHAFDPSGVFAPGRVVGRI